MINQADIRKKIKDLDEMRAEFLAQVRPVDGIQALASAQPMIVPGSKEHEALLSTGYGMNKAKAQTIIKEYKADPRSWPYEMLEKAQNFMETLRAKPQVISTRQPWRVRGHSRALDAVG